MADFFRGNFFANTPDILHEYLQRGGPPAFRIRLLLAGTLSPLYGIYSGFELSENVPVREGSEEYLDSEKYQVRVRDWSAPGNLDADITPLNRDPPRRAGAPDARQHQLPPGRSSRRAALCEGRLGPRSSVRRVASTRSEPVDAELELPLEQLGSGRRRRFEVEDLLTGERSRWRGARQDVRFDPAERVGLHLAGDSRRGRCGVTDESGLVPRRDHLSAAHPGLPRQRRATASATSPG